MKIAYLFALLILSGSHFLCGQEKSLIKFKENKNQWPSPVKFMGEFYNGKVFLENNSFTYEIYNASELSASIEKYGNKEKDDSPIHGQVYKTVFLNASTKKIYGNEKQTEYYNYFLGKDESKWSSHVLAFKKITYENLYDGIDMNVYSEGSNFKYDLLVSPYADAGKIQLQVENTNELFLKDKNLHIKTNAGTIIEKEPFAWQQIGDRKVVVECQYELKDKHVSFSFPKGYNKKYPLVIDPVVVTATFTGSTVYCYGEASAYDEKGNAYLLGHCASPGFPATAGAFQTSLDSIIDVTLHKFNADGSQLLFATYIGGDADEKSFCVNAFQGETTIFGYTLSNNFPVSQNAFDTSYNGNYDMFITKMDTTGAVIHASTYIGGSDDDGAPGAWNPFQFRNYEFVQDDAANVYAVSSTNSLDFPVSALAYSTSISGVYDAVAFKLDSSLSVMKWSTYFGGSNRDCANGLRLDGSGGIYFTGTTQSANLPVTTGVAGPTYAGGSHDAFVTHLTADGSSVAASSFAGTGGNDYGYLVTLDKNKNVLLYSILISGAPSVFTPTPGAYNVVAGHNLIYKLTPDLSQYTVKARFGPAIFNSSQSFLAAAAFEVDSCDNIYIAGDAGASFPTTPNAIKASTNNYDLYFCVFSKNATALSYASYYGGIKAEWATFGICKVDPRGRLYYSFNGNSSTPVSPNAYSPSLMPADPSNAKFDHGFLKVDLQTFLTATSYSSQLQNGCVPYDMTFINQSPSSDIKWVFGDGSAPVLLSDTVNHTYTSVGTYDLLLIATDTSTCNNVDTLITKINVFLPPTANLSDSTDLCINSEAVLNAGNAGHTYLWSTGETTQSIETTTIGNYSVIISNPGCSVNDSSVVFVSKANFAITPPNIITPNGDNLNDKLEFSNLALTDFQLSIFDRWGTEVYSSNASNSPWNGMINGKVVDGTYFYTLNYKTDCFKAIQTSKGFITVIK